MTINPWINFNGNAEEAFGFYKSVFGGEFTSITRFKDISSMKVSDAEAEKILRIGLPIGDAILYGNDVPSILGKVSENENRSKIIVNTESKAEADRIFKGLSAGGQVEGEMSEGPFGTYFGMFRDKYGIEWMIEFAAK